MRSGVVQNRRGQSIECSIEWNTMRYNGITYQRIAHCTSNELNQIEFSENQGSLEIFIY